MPVNSCQGVWAIKAYNNTKSMLRLKTKTCMKNYCGSFPNGNGVCGEKEICMSSRRTGGRDRWWLWSVHRSY